MRKKLKLLSVLMLAVLSVNILAACGEQNSDTTVSEGINEVIDLSDYTLVYSDKSANVAEKELTLDLRDYIKETYDIKLTVNTDAEPENASRKEIIIGDVKYSYMSEIKNDIAGLDYIIKIKGEKIMIYSEQLTQLSKGVESFKSDYLEKSEGKLTLKKSDDFIYRHDDSSDYALKVLSLNLRTAKSASANNQSIREPRIVKFVEDNKPDTIATQECEVFWRERLDIKLGELGYNRVLKIHPNPNAAKNQMWYNPEVLSVVDSGVIWLSETPEVASQGFGSSFFISAGWAILKHKATGEVFAQVNTHLDAYNAETRKSETVVLSDFIKTNFIDKGYNLILSGDFNSYEDSEIYEAYSGFLTDVRKVAKESTEMNTFNRYKNNENEVLDVSAYSRIDYIFIHGQIEAQTFEVYDRWDGGYMSDHNALMTNLKIIKY